jgi:hypothetical protein
VATHTGTVPTHLTVPASQIPPGDLTLDLFVESSVDGTLAASHATMGARVPFSASGLRVGSTRYRVTVQVAPSWARRVCHTTHCNGTQIRLILGGKTYSDYIDEDGQAIFTVVGRSKATSLSVALRSASSKYKHLNMTYLRVSLPSLKAST